MGKLITMSDPTLIADLVRARVDAELVGRVANAIASTALSIVPDMSRTMSRTYEADRKREYRKTLTKSGGKQTMSATTNGAECPGHVPDNAKGDCNFLPSLLSKKESLPRKEASKKELRTEFVSLGKKGTRLLSDNPLLPAWREFARAQGLTDARIDRAWPEFVDYWIAVPGARGVKLNWFSTWRNRVRKIVEYEGKSNGPRSLQSDKSVTAAALRSIERSMAKRANGADILSLSARRLPEPGSVSGTSENEPAKLPGRDRGARN